MNKEEQQKAFHDYQKATLEHYKNRKRKVLKILLIVVIVYSGLLLYSKWLGSYLYLPLPNKIDRYYEIELNGSPFNVGVIRNEKVPFIPFVLYWDRVKEFTSYPKKELAQQTISADNYILSIQVYSSMDEEYFIEELKQKKISVNIKNMKIYKYKYYDKNEDYVKIINIENYTALEVQKRKEFFNKDLYEIVYDGKYIEDITNYINDDNLYGIELYYKKNTLRFGFVKRENNVTLF